MASRRLTSATMTAGVVVSAVCFLVAVVGEVIRGSSAGRLVTDLTLLLDGLASLDPASWASLGTFVLMVTPVLGLVVTALEYVQVGDRTTVALALLVLGVLALSGAVAVVS